MSDFPFENPTGRKWSRGITNFRARRRGGSRTARQPAKRAKDRSPWRKKL